MKLSEILACEIHRVLVLRGSYEDMDGTTTTASLSRVTKCRCAACRAVALKPARLKLKADASKRSTLTRCRASTTASAAARILGRWQMIWEAPTSLVSHCNSYINLVL
jgi:hypothetical protein